MRDLLQRIPIRWLGLIVWGSFVLSLTTLPGWIPLVYVPAQVIGYTVIFSTIGQATLFGVLTLLMWRTLSQWLETPIDLGITMFVILSLATSTEIFQWFVATRNASFDDLLANYVGILVVGFTISYIQNLNHLAHKYFL